MGDLNTRSFQCNNPPSIRQNWTHVIQAHLIPHRFPFGAIRSGYCALRGLPVGEIAVTPKGEKELRAALNRALLYGKEVLQIVSASDGRGVYLGPFLFNLLRECVGKTAISGRGTNIS
ncbi:hypothetical protein BH20PSE1_BH20PSE1_17040 [soil metagenome]